MLDGKSYKSVIGTSEVREQFVCMKRGGVAKTIMPPYLHRNHADQGKQRNGPNHDPDYLLSRHGIVRHEWRVIWNLGPSEEDTRRK